MQEEKLLQKVLCCYQNGWNTPAFSGDGALLEAGVAVPGWRSRLLCCVSCVCAAFPLCPGMSLPSIHGAASLWCQRGFISAACPHAFARASPCARVALQPRRGSCKARPRVLCMGEGTQLLLLWLGRARHGWGVPPARELPPRHWHEVVSSLLAAELLEAWCQQHRDAPASRGP